MEDLLALILFLQISAQLSKLAYEDFINFACCQYRISVESQSIEFYQSFALCARFGF